MIERVTAAPGSGTDAISSAVPVRPRVALFCHHDEPVNRWLLPRWLATFCDVAGIVEIREQPGMVWRRLGRERRRMGSLRLLDVLGFRLFYRARFAARDAEWLRGELQRLSGGLSQAPEPPVVVTANPNEDAVKDFLRSVRPDLAIARCKWLLRKEVYSVPTMGTLVMHPGICPEYRNAHGVFWALARKDPGRVGLTLLQIDDGIDTGPVYGYFRCAFDPRTESHIRIQHRLVLDNLDGLRDSLLRIAGGSAQPIPTEGRPSGNWGQPWLTAFLRYRKSLEPYTP